MSPGGARPTRRAGRPIPGPQDTGPQRNEGSLKNALRIAHCSDIHLDGDAEDARDFYRQAFAVALADIGAHEPDLLMLAGDLFDSNSATADTIEWAMAILGRQPFPIVMIPGNHDCLAEDAIYRRYDFNRIDNVDLLLAETGDMVRLPSLDAAVWGKGMTDHSPAFSPLGDCPARPADCRWYLGLGHGIFVPHGEETGRSSPIHMHQVEDSPCDYLALGHHHAAMELVTDRTAAAYSGSPTDSIGRGATYVMVDLSGAGDRAVTIHTVDDRR